MDIFKQRKIFSILFSIVIIFNIFFLFIYFKQGSHTPVDQAKMKRIRELEDNLNLDFDQFYEIGVIKRETERFIMPKRQEIQTYKHRIIQEVLKENPDSSRVAEFSREIGLLQESIETTDFQRRIRIKNILRPDQIDAFRQLIQEQSKSERPERPEHRRR